MSAASANIEQMFIYFRDMGEKRSAVEVAKHFKVTPAYISKIRKKFDWDERVRDYDSEIAAEVKRRTIIERTKLVKNVTDFAKEVFNDFCVDYRKLKKETKGHPFQNVDAQGNKVLNVQLLDKILTKAMPFVVQEEDDDGSNVPVVVELPVRRSVSDNGE